jgi:hypothetical protein
MVEMDSNMQQFLGDRRISIADLSKKAQTSDSNETAAERRERLRDLAIKKRVSLSLRN